MTEAKYKNVLEKKRPALLLIKPEKEEEVKEVLEEEITELINKEETPEVPETFLVSSTNKIGKEGLIIEQLRLSKFFKDYSSYDDWLLKLVQERGFGSLEDKALLIGHIDKSNHLWTDYSTETFLTGAGTYEM